MIHIYFHYFSFIPNWDNKYCVNIVPFQEYVSRILLSPNLIHFQDQEE